MYTPYVCICLCICTCKCICICIRICICICICTCTCTCICLRPENRPSVFAFFGFLDYFGVGGAGWGGGVGYSRPWSSSFTTCVLMVFSTSLHTHTHTLHVTLTISGWGGVWWVGLLTSLVFVLHDLLCWICLLYVVARISCYVASSQPKR